MKVISVILDKLLGREETSELQLQQFTGLNPTLIAHAIRQLTSVGIIASTVKARDHSSWYALTSPTYALTQRGINLYREYHFGTRGEVTVEGDFIKAEANSNVTNRSIIINSLNRVQSDLDEKSQAALKTLTAEVLVSGNAEAEENLEEFLSQLDAVPRKESVLNSLLNGIVAALPSLASAADVIETVRKIIAGT